VRTRAVREILESAGAPDRDAEAFADQWGENFFAIYDGQARSGPGNGQGFRTIAEITAEALAATYRQNGLELDPWPGTALWLEWLGRVEPYAEARAVLRALSANFRLAMVTDIDDRVIAPALARLDWEFEFVLTSESQRAYKHHPDGLIFERALQRLGCRPEQAAHVGDSAADVTGARSCGMLAVWVNRYGRALPAGCPVPDRTVRDLRSLPGLLEPLA
jgi:2-haloalkanoic acid dehalogenase type II